MTRLVRREPDPPFWPGTSEPEKPKVQPEPPADIRSWRFVTVDGGPSTGLIVGIFLLAVGVILITIGVLL